MTTSDVASPRYTLDLHAELYPPEEVRRAVAAFAGTGEFSVEPHGRHTRVTITARAGQEVEHLAHSFANYVLCLVMTVARADSTAETAASPASAAADLPAGP